MITYDIDGITVMPPLLAEYRLDPTLDIKHKLVSFEQGYSHEYHNIFKNTLDFSFNKSSNFYLTDQNYYDDVIELLPLPEEYPTTISTFLAFNRLYSDPLSALTATTACLTSVSAISALSATDTTSTYITIANIPGDSSDITTTRACSAELFTDIKTGDTLDQKYYCNVTFIDGKDCIIYHRDGVDIWYLSHKEELGAVLQFTKIVHDYGMGNIVDQIIADGGNKIVFQYAYYESENILRLYKQFNDVTCIIRLLTDSERLINPDNVPIRLEPLKSPDNDNNNVTNAPNSLELTENTSLRTRPGLGNLYDNSLNSSIYNYNTTLNYSDLSVNKMTSDLSVKNNLAVHSEYYFLTGESLPVNVFPLKNQQTATGLSSPNNPWTLQSPNQHRHYNKIFTGTNQLQGTDKIYFDYTTSTSQLEIKPGMNFFNFPQLPDPVTRLNINDSTLIFSGSIAADKPSRADKIYKKRAGYAQTTRWGDPSDEHTGTWLCAWLSGGDIPDSKPQWVDRYYNPSLIGGINALTITTDTIHSKYESENDVIFTSSNNEIYDEPSKLTFEPGASYAYYRINRRDITNNLSILSPNHIQSNFNSYTTINQQQQQPEGRVYQFNNNNYAICTDLTQAESTGNLSISFDVNFKDYKHVIGHQVLGNYTNNGIGIYNTNDVSPFVFILGSDGASVNGTKQNSSIRIYDTNYNLYNYIINDSFTDDNITPGLFKDIIIRDLPDNIFCIMSTGVIVEFTHDGIVIATYNDWLDNVGSVYMNNILHTAYDDQLIYILSATGSRPEDYIIHIFNMVTREFSIYDDIECVVEIPIPDELGSINIDYNYGRIIDTNGPPTLIYVKDDIVPYNDKRTVYVATGDSIKSGEETLWVHVNGAVNNITSVPEKHDVIYGFNTTTLELLPGKLTDNKLESSDVLLDIIDYTTDNDGNIWLAHSGNIISKYTHDRRLLNTQIIEEQEILSIVISRDLNNAEIEERLIVLGKTIGGRELSLPIGPTPHPTNDRNSIYYRHASEWIEGGEINRRPDKVDPSNTDIIYPFTDGNNRFGTQIQSIDATPSSNIAGIVTNDDYTIITDAFDVIVEELNDVIYGNIISLANNKVVDIKSLNNFIIDDVNDKPQMITQYQYGKENYPHFYTHNLNLKLLLDPLFGKAKPEVVILKLNLEDLSSVPYTGWHNICINVCNKTGRVEFWVDGTLDESRVHTFAPEKYRFNNLTSQNITCGTTPYLNDTILSRKIKRTDSYMINNTELKNLNIYNTELKYHDQLNLMRMSHTIPVMYWDVPSGLRNHIEGIDRVFNHSIPPVKSNTYDMVVQNSLIQSPALQSYITNKIKTTLINITPAHTNVRDISWTNELLET
tara:strand:+ start:6292 stop:10356 length:4065 start_codon:yes stop_codon:yes gene_type:complete